MSTVTIEDSDGTGVLVYEPADVWQTATDTSDPSNTSHLSKEANANVTLTFTGTEVRVKGGLTQGTQVAYMFDDSAVTLAPANPGHTTILQLSSQACAEHSLKLITQPDQHLAVDNFVFVSCTPDASASATTSADPTVATTSATTSDDPTVTGNNVSPASPSASTMTTNAMTTGSSPAASPIPASLAAKSNNTGVIAGVTVSVLLVLAVLAAFLFWWMRRRGMSLCGWRKNRTAPSAAYLTREKGFSPSSYGGGHSHTESTTQLTATFEPSVKYIGDVKVYDGGYDATTQGQGSSTGSFLNLKKAGNHKYQNSSAARSLRIDTSLPWRSPGGSVV
ncbi:unnamed protein product [Peniophora sp. CBMAI 1063]|nr:unnamed protein product [Peniophora sp. CBMAI 1063]